MIPQIILLIGVGICLALAVRETWWPR